MIAINLRHGFPVTVCRNTGEVTAAKCSVVLDGQTPFTDIVGRRITQRDFKITWVAAAIGCSSHRSCQSIEQRINHVALGKSTRATYTLVRCPIRNETQSTVFTLVGELPSNHLAIQTAHIGI